MRLRHDPSVRIHRRRVRFGEGVDDLESGARDGKENELGDSCRPGSTVKGWSLRFHTEIPIGPW